MNGIIHPACHPEDLPAPSSEEEMYLAIFKYIDRVFNKRPQEFFVAKFKNLSPGKSYKIILSTFLNGTLMAQTVSTVATR